MIPPDPWASAAGTGPTVDVAAEFISKRRSARDAAKTFLQRKYGQAKSAVGSAAQAIGSALPPGGPPGGYLPYAAGAAALGALGTAAYMQKRRQDKNAQAAMAAQLAQPIAY